jgi:hypothetical protein
MSLVSCLILGVAGEACPVYSYALCALAFALASALALALGECIQSLGALVVVVLCCAVVVLCYAVSGMVLCYAVLCYGVWGMRHLMSSVFSATSHPFSCSCYLVFSLTTLQQFTFYKQSVHEEGVESRLQ